MSFRLASGLVCALAFCLAVSGPANAQAIQSKQPKAVVELFTSQGCASCPPADALLTSLAARDDVVALAYHVDYWDYIGWEDTFGDKGYSDRQRAYAKSWGSSRIFTPQMVVNGTQALVGSKRNDVQAAVTSATLSLPVSIERQADMLKVKVPANASLGDASIWLVRYLDRADVSIERGDNAGKSMVYTQVVTGRQLLGAWEASTGAEIKLPLSELGAAADTGIAVLVQHERSGLPGAILGAATYHF